MQNSIELLKAFTTKEGLKIRPAKAGESADYTGKQGGKYVVISDSKEGNNKKLHDSLGGQYSQPTEIIKNYSKLSDNEQLEVCRYVTENVGYRNIAFSYADKEVSEKVIDELLTKFDEENGQHIYALEAMMRCGSSPVARDKALKKYQEIHGKTTFDDLLITDNIDKNIDSIISGYEMSSGSDQALWLKVAVKKVLNNEEEPFETGVYREIYRYPKNEYYEIVDKLYNQTQKYYADKGIKKIKLYRGIGSQFGKIEMRDTDVLSSWTTNKDIANFHAHRGDINDRRVKTNIISREIPIEDILYSYETVPQLKNKTPREIIDKDEEFVVIKRPGSTLFKSENTIEKAFTTKDGLIIRPAKEGETTTFTGKRGGKYVIIRDGTSKETTTKRNTKKQLDAEKVAYIKEITEDTEKNRFYRLSSIYYPDPKTVNTEKDTTEANRKILSMASKIIPLDHLYFVDRIQFFDKEGPAFSYEDPISNVKYNTSTAATYDGSDREIEMFSTANARSLIHEIGHSLYHGDLLIQVGRSTFNRHIGWPYRQKLYKIYKECIEKNKGFPSEYSKTNEKEFFAEGYLFYMTTPQELKKRNMKLYELIDTIVNDDNNKIKGVARDHLMWKHKTKTRMHDKAEEAVTRRK